MHNGQTTDTAMANLTIRKIDPAVKDRLRLRAAMHGHSMEEEARRILSDACGPTDCPETLADIALELFGAEGGVELDIPPRQPVREPPDFR